MEQHRGPLAQLSRGWARSARFAGELSRCRRSCPSTWPRWAPAPGCCCSPSLLLGVCAVGGKWQSSFSPLERSEEVWWTGAGEFRNWFVSHKGRFKEKYSDPCVELVAADVSLAPRSQGLDISGDSTRRWLGVTGLEAGTSVGPGAGGENPGCEIVPVAGKGQAGLGEGQGCCSCQHFPFWVANS